MMKDSSDFIQAAGLFSFGHKEFEMQDERVFDNSVSGKPEHVVSTILRKISAHTRETLVSGFRIGITNHPRRRFDRHKRDYDEMIVIYRSTSLKFVRDLECELIEHNRELADNFVGGGGGRAGAPPHFMYVVIKYR